MTAVASPEEDDPGLTVKEYAALHRVDERTVYRWIKRGVVATWRTPGGGIRIERRKRARRPATNYDND